MADGKDQKEFAEPSGATSFLERYQQARAANASTKPLQTGAARGGPAGPRMTPPSSKSKDVWSSVFHPHGKPSTKADRYDLVKKASPTWESVSEIHVRGKDTISLDQPAEEK